MSKNWLVIPCYNEAQRLPFEEFNEFLSSEYSLNLMLLFVNDGSTDNTLEVLNKLKTKYPNQVEVYDLQANAGKAEAVRKGFLKAFESKPELVGFADADLSVKLKEMSKLFNVALESAHLNIVMGSRIKRMGSEIVRSEVRHILGRVFSTFASWILKLAIYDTQCGAKVFRREQTEQIFQQKFITSWLFDIELIARYRNLYGKKFCYQTIYEYPLNQWIEVGGSKLKLSHYFKVPAQLFRIWRAY
jgi:glycosyltransferase involved in cell wall biosynthesis